MWSGECGIAGKPPAARALRGRAGAPSLTNHDVRGDPAKRGQQGAGSEEGVGRGQGWGKVRGASEQQSWKGWHRPLFPFGPVGDCLFRTGSVCSRLLPVGQGRCYCFLLVPVPTARLASVVSLGARDLWGSRVGVVGGFAQAVRFLCCAFLFPVAGDSVGEIQDWYLLCVNAGARTRGPAPRASLRRVLVEGWVDCCTVLCCDLT